MFLRGLKAAEIVRKWVGLRVITPDKQPLLGPTSIEGFLLATGFSGIGI